MAFDFLRFFDANNISYKTRGSNVSKNNVAIHCPFCGSADDGQHLSVNIHGRGYRCFRNNDHCGGKAARLIAALLGVDYSTAARIAGEQIFVPENFMDKIGALLKPQPEPKERTLEMLPEFKPFDHRKFAARPFVNYLEGKDRGFERRDFQYFAKLFDLHYATKGAFHHRIIFPIVEDGKLVNWTGRAISPNAVIRYKTLATEPEPDDPLPAAIGPITKYLLFFDQLMDVDADTIYLCEGPFDALKIWYLGLTEGIVASCFFTASASLEQIDRLHQLLPRYKRKFMLLDSAMTHRSLKIAGQLSSLGVKPFPLPAKYKDPGVLDRIDPLL